MGSTYLLAHFLGNFREKTKKVPTLGCAIKDLWGLWADS